MHSIVAMYANYYSYLSDEYLIMFMISGHEIVCEFSPRMTAANELAASDQNQA